MVAGGMLQTFDDDDDQYESSPATNTTAKGAKSKPADAPSIIYLMSLLSAIGGFLFGYDTGIVSGAMVFVRKIFNLNSLWQELVVSITILGAWILSLMAGSLSERYGRKTMILYASVVFTVGSVIMGVAWSKYILLFGRLTVGVAIGIASTVVPMYIAELAPSNIRGSLVTLNNCFITVGQLSAAITAGAFSYDHDNGWRWMLALAAVPATLQFFGFLFVPESPRWLIRHDREDEALAALKKIRGSKACVLKEFDKIRQNQLELVVQEERRKQQKRNIIVAIFKKTATRRALTVGCLLQAAQQLAGINTVMYYTATIIEMSGVQSQSIAVWLAVPTATVYVIFSFGAYLVADRVGRRSLVLGSLLGVILSLLLLGTGFHLTSMSEAKVTASNMSTLEACYTKSDCTSCIADPRCGFCYDAVELGVATCLSKNPEDDTRSIGGDCALGNTNSNFVFVRHICPSMTQGIGLNTWLVLTGLVLYLAAFALGMAPMPWTINSEIYPMWARSFCYSIATSVNWMCNLLISLTFISLTELITTHGAFYMYAIISSFAWLVLFWILPETRGRSLEDISSLFSKTKQPDDMEIMDDGASANQSSVGGTVGQQRGISIRQIESISGRAYKSGNVMCHDNLAFTADNITPGSQMAKSAPTDDHFSSMAERNRSFKLASPLSKVAAAALSQPDLQEYQPNAPSSQRQQQNPLSEEGSFAGLITDSKQSNSSPPAEVQQQAPRNAHQRQQHQQQSHQSRTQWQQYADLSQNPYQQQSRRKYSDGGRS